MAYGCSADDWAEDGTVVLTLDCHPRYLADRVMTFADLLKELRNLCPWQLAKDVVIGIKTAFVEVLTVYHEFDLARTSNSLYSALAPPLSQWPFGVQVPHEKRRHLKSISNLPRPSHQVNNTQQEPVFSRRAGPIILTTEPQHDLVPAVV